MCIAILNNGNVISEEHFKNSLKANPDGFGMAYIEKGKIKVFRSLSDNFKSLYGRYLKVYNSNEYPIMLHFRISTSGGVNLENCHPFYISKNVVFCHNGIINNWGTKTMSDTRHFNRDILSNFSDKDLIHNKSLTELISGYIDFSKFIILDNNGDFNIINEDLGHWDNDNNWFSNKSYLTSHKFDKGWYKELNEFDNIDNFGKCESCLEYKTVNYDSLFKTYICSECSTYYEDTSINKIWD
jgi:predicted glutamine amidotransferase